MRKRIETIPTQATIEEMHEMDEEGRTPFATAVVTDAPVELLERMIELDKQDTMKRNIGMVCDGEGRTTLQLATEHRTDAATIKLVVSENPGALFFALKYALEYN